MQELYKGEGEVNKVGVELKHVDELTELRLVWNKMDDVHCIGFEIPTVDIVDEEYNRVLKMSLKAGGNERLFRCQLIYKAAVRHAHALLEYAEALDGDIDGEIEIPGSE